MLNDSKWVWCGVPFALNFLTLYIIHCNGMSNCISSHLRPIKSGTSVPLRALPHASSYGIQSRTLPPKLQDTCDMISFIRIYRQSASHAPHIFNRALQFPVRNDLGKVCWLLRFGLDTVADLIALLQTRAFNFNTTLFFKNCCAVLTTLRRRCYLYFSILIFFYSHSFLFLAQAT